MLKNNRYGKGPGPISNYFEKRLRLWQVRFAPKDKMLALSAHPENIGTAIEAMAGECPVLVTPEVGLGVRP